MSKENITREIYLNVKRYDYKLYTDICAFVGTCKMEDEVTCRAIIEKFIMSKINKVLNDLNAND